MNSLKDYTDLVEEDKPEQLILGRDQPGTSGVKRPRLDTSHPDSDNISDDLTPNRTQSSQQSSHSGTQEAAREILGNPSREQETRPIPSATIVPEVAEASGSEMVLPGTAQGQGGSGDGNSNNLMPIYRAPRPFTNFGTKISTYKKVHRFITFGLAHNFINKTASGSGGNQRWLTTFLAAIPWERPYLYLNPSEFELLARGAICKEVRIKIVHRGSRIAFETATSTSGLATLNQIQNIGIAHGLNKTGYGTDITPSAFVADQPMIPSNFTVPTNLSNNYENSWYGYWQSSANFTNEIPDHQVGYKSLLRDYFALVTKTNSSNTDNNNMGFPCLAENIQFFDGKTTINQVVGEFSYRPVVGFLKVPHQFLRFGLPDITAAESVTVDVQHNLINSERASININTINENSTAGYTITSASDYQITTLIEKSQLTKQGVWGQFQNAKIQPSIHVGIQPIPSLSTPALTLTTRSYTDSQADWEVYAEIDIEEHVPTAFARSGVPNVPIGNVVMKQTGASVPDFTCTVAGLKPSQGITFVP